MRVKRCFLIGKYNTWYDWGLTLTAKDTPPPEPYTNYVTLDGAHGTLDLSEALTGEVVYQDRTLTASFLCSRGTYREREGLLRDIRAAIHGRVAQLVEPDDPDHFFQGRVQIKSITRHEAYHQFTLEAICKPWRYAIHESRRAVAVADHAVGVVIRNQGSRTVCPALTVEGEVTVTANEIPTRLEAGSYKLADLKLTPGINLIQVSGRGSVLFTYREGVL